MCVSGIADLTEDDVQRIRTLFSKQIASGKAPSRTAIKKAKKGDDVLKSIHEEAIYSWIAQHIATNQR